MNYLTYPAHDDYLAHYGVKGQKWGVRRYQAKDGTLTAEGKKRAKQEYRADNKKAYELGKSATIYGHATAKALKRTVKLENKLDKQYAKDPQGTSRRTQALKSKWDASTKTVMQLSETYNKYKTTAEQHCKSLVKKYGKEAVDGISYKEKKLPKGTMNPTTFKTMNERTNNLSDYAIAGAASVAGSVMLALMGSPYAMVCAPRTTGQKASEMESAVYRANRKAQKNK